MSGLGRNSPAGSGPTKVRFLASRRCPVLARPGSVIGACLRVVLGVGCRRRTNAGSSRRPATFVPPHTHVRFRSPRTGRLTREAGQSPFTTGLRRCGCDDAGIEALRRQRLAPRFRNGDLYLQERAPDTVAIKARRSASISSGSSSAAKWPPRGMSVQCTML